MKEEITEKQNKNERKYLHILYIYIHIDIVINGLF